MAWCVEGKKSIRLGVRKSRFKTRLCQARAKCWVFFKGREEMVRRGKMVSGDKRTERSKKTFLRS